MDNETERDSVTRWDSVTESERDGDSDCERDKVADRESDGDMDLVVDDERDADGDFVTEGDGLIVILSLMECDVETELDVLSVVD